MKSRFSDVRTVLQNFRYATLTQFVGRRFTVFAAETLREDISRLCQELTGSNEQSPRDFGYLPLQIAKYGILDLRFDVARDTFECEFQSGKSLMRELGFGGPAASEWTSSLPEFDILSEIASQMQDDHWLLMILAKIVGNAETGRNLVRSIRESNDLSLLPLPAEFEITDACITNSSYAWLSKHFYW